ncbi:MAG TPA: 6-phosphogluconolactonase [Dissulfurispiraceae bacterium]|nr:6-phosphogluconolactonase [Dissulfurispiraceae bacterium]
MMTDPCIHVFDDRKEMNSFLIKKWTEIGMECIERRGVFAAALSGGGTPTEFYRELASASSAFPWDKTHIFLVDERFVPISEAVSNFGMLRTCLLSGLNMPPGNIHFIMTDTASPVTSANEYEEELMSFFGLIVGEVPVFDFIGLGLGADGHTASLFPGSPEAEVPLAPESSRLVVAVRRDNVMYARVSLTLTVINNARDVVFIVTGGSKAAIVKRVVEDRDMGFPASRVEPSSGNLTFVLDSEAASMLNK